MYEELEIISFIYFSIFVKNRIVYESCQVGMGKFILIYTMKFSFEFVPV